MRFPTMYRFFCFKPSPAGDGDDEESQHSGEEAAALEPETELISYYQEACRLDPNLADLNLFLSNVSILDSENLRSHSDGLRTAILELDDVISGDQDLLCFVADFFRNHVQTLFVFAAVRGSLADALETHSLLLDALHLAGAGAGAASLEKLREFKAARSPFRDELKAELTKFIEKQKLMLIRLQRKSRGLGKKLVKVNAWKKVFSVVSRLALAGAIISSVVLAAVATPAVAAAGAAAVAGAEPLSKWFGSLWVCWEGKWKRKKDAVKTMRQEAIFAINELETIRVWVEKIEISIGSSAIDGLMAVMAMGEEEKVVEDMKRKAEGLSEKMVMADEEVDRCSGEVRKMAAKVMTVFDVC